MAKRYLANSRAKEFSSSANSSKMDSTTLKGGGMLRFALLCVMRHMRFGTAKEKDRSG